MPRLQGKGGWIIVLGLGIYWGYIGIIEKKMETTISGLGFKAYAAEFKGVFD